MQAGSESRYTVGSSVVCLLISEVHLIKPNKHARQFESPLAIVGSWTWKGILVVERTRFLAIAHLVAARWCSVKLANLSLCLDAESDMTVYPSALFTVGTRFWLDCFWRLLPGTSWLVPMTFQPDSLLVVGIILSPLHRWPLTADAVEKLRSSGELPIKRFSHRRDIQHPDPGVYSEIVFFNVCQLKKNFEDSLVRLP